LRSADKALLEYAFDKKMLILTHDSDFGKLGFAQGIRFWAVLYLRPGHINASIHIQTLQSLLSSSIEVEQGFLAVAKNQGSVINLRIRKI